MKVRRYAAIVLLLAAMTWLASGNDGWRGAFAWQGKKWDYYNLLVHGFLKGHLYLDAPVDPGLLSADPAVRHNAPFLLDASLYGGRYYLYFGVVPAVLLFLPYRWVTGQDLPENAAALLLVALGFLCYLQLYRAAKRRYFPTLSAVPNACCVLLLAFGAGTPILLIDGGFYEIAIAGGYLFLALYWLCLYRAWQARTRGWLALGCSSLAAGLAVGCRPNCILALPALALTALLLARRQDAGSASSGRRRWVRLAAAAVLPAGAVGLGLMAYNYARFHNPLEFGFHYQLSALVDGHWPLARLSFFWPNLRWYYLRPAVLSPYFPYLFPMNAQDRPPGYYGYEAIHGQFPVLGLMLLAGVGWGIVRRRRPAPPRSLELFLALLAGEFIALFLGMAFFGFRANRYIPDFQATLILLLTLAGGYGAASLDPARPGFRAWRAAFCGLAVVTALGNILIGMQWVDRLQNVRPRTYDLLARWGEYPAYLCSRWGLLPYGPIRLHLDFPQTSAAAWRPILATGTPNASDVLRVVQQPPGMIQFDLSHEGYGSLRSDPVPLTPGEHVIEVEEGSLYPPRIDPYFRGWTPEEIERLKTTSRVLFDGQEVIHGRLKCYDSPPSWVEVGRDPAGTDPPFAGKITSVERLPVGGRQALALSTEAGVWRLQVELPERPSANRSPVLGSGVAGHGNLLFLTRLPDHRVTFSLDQWGIGLVSSPPLSIEPDTPHLLEIFVGCQVARHLLPPGGGAGSPAATAAASVFRLWLDGTPVWTTTIAVNQDSYDFVSIGSNPQGFSTAPAFFAGTIRSLPYSPADMRTFIAKNLASIPTYQRGDGRR